VVSADGVRAVGAGFTAGLVEMLRRL